MRKRSLAAVSLALCAAVGVCACSNKEENVFTGETVEEPAWQANLDVIAPAVYGDIEDLTLEPGTYISGIG